MGGHGGLNILPQKRWNVYNFDNREKVRLDEEAAAKEEQIKREQSRKRDTELRVLKLRQLRGLPEASPEPKPDPKEVEVVEEKKEGAKHINLFDGIKIFDPKQGGIDIEAKMERKEDKGSKRGRKEKKEEVKVVSAEDEIYRLGYGLVGKGSKLPWYLAKKREEREESDGDEECQVSRKRERKGKKSLEELREERLTRERKEKERERALFREKSRRDSGFSLRR